jgi:hypothetical protein
VLHVPSVMIKVDIFVLRFINVRAINFKQFLLFQNQLHKQYLDFHSLCRVAFRTLSTF